MDQPLADPIIEQMIMPRRPRLGFLGVGWIGRHRLESLVRSNLVEIAAIADPVNENLMQAMETAPSAEGVDDLNGLLARGLDGIVIATPSGLHADQARAALSAGVPVFCQKPLALTRGATRQVVAAARRADCLLGVDLSYRYLNGLDQIRRMIARGDIGRVYAAELVFHNAYGPDKNWYRDRHLSGGGCVMDLGTHLVDLMRQVLPEGVVRDVRSRLYAGARPLRKCGSNQVEDYADVQLTLQDNATVRLACSWFLQAGVPAHIRAVFYGEKGGLCLRNVDGSFFTFLAEHYLGTECRILVPPGEDWWGAAVVDWARRLAHSGAYDSEVEQLIGVAEIIDAIYEVA